jgi:tRNA threonylcarbamoyladenosine biosynthesis protein TsaB
MFVLGIETSTKTGSVAVLSENGVIAQYSLNIEVTHSERLMSTVDRVLTDTGITVANIDAFAVSIGPGSFTGLRIGLATVKGLALATRNLPFAAYSVCPLLDARKNEVYAALYRLEGATTVLVMPETTIPIKQLAERIPGTALFTGEASILYHDEIVMRFGGRCLFAPRSATLPSAATVAEIGLDMIKRGKQTDPDNLTPLYIRRPEAEVAWEKKQTSR